MLDMVEAGHIVHASAMKNEKFHLAWGNLDPEGGYPEEAKWGLGDDPPPNLSLGIDEEVVRTSGLTYDILLHHAVVDDSIKKVYQGLTVFTEGDDYEIVEGYKISWDVSGGSAPASNSGYNVIYRYLEPNILGLVNEVGRRRATVNAFVTEDPMGDIEANDKTWRIVEEAQGAIIKLTFSDASEIGAGSYLNIYTPFNSYYLWFKVNGSGIDPNLDQAIAIGVNIQDTDTEHAVAEAVHNVLNSDFSEVFESVLSNGEVTIENVDNGDVLNSADVNTNTTVTILRTGNYYPTSHIHLFFKFEGDESAGNIIFQLGLFLNTIPKSTVPEDQEFLTVGEIEDFGTLYMIENVEPFPRPAGKRELFEYVITY